MATSSLATMVACLTLLASLCGCTRGSSGIPLDLESLRQLNSSHTSQILYEEKGGEILVTIVDQHADAHIHVLILGGSTKSEALELLRQKRAELDRARGG